MTHSSSMGPMRDVREGMTVHDSSGDEIGSVSMVKLSDPDVATSAGQESETGITGAPVLPVAPVNTTGAAGTGGVGMGTGGAPLAGVFALGTVGADEPDVPPALAERLLRTGYIKIDKGLFRRDLYVGADQIESVVDDEVALKVSKDELIKEA